MDAPGTGYEVTSPEGVHLLYLPPGAAPSGLADRAPRPYDMVVGDVVGRPDAVARLRAVEAIGPTTEIIAVHLDHDAPPAAELGGGSRRPARGPCRTGRRWWWASTARCRRYPGARW